MPHVVVPDDKVRVRVYDVPEDQNTGDLCDAGMTNVANEEGTVGDGVLIAPGEAKFILKSACLLNGGPFGAVCAPNILAKVKAGGEFDLERRVGRRKSSAVPHQLSLLKSGKWVVAGINGTVMFRDLDEQHGSVSYNPGESFFIHGGDECRPGDGCEKKTFVGDDEGETKVMQHKKRATTWTVAATVVASSLRSLSVPA